MAARSILGAVFHKGAAAAESAMRCFALSRTSSTTQAPRRRPCKDEPSSSCSSEQRGTTSIRNQTEHTIVFRDMYRQQLGRLRHTIPPHSERCVEVDIAGVDTYYQMVVLAKSISSSLTSSRSSSSSPHAEDCSTNIWIDTDDMALNNEIILSASGDTFSVEKIERQQKRRNP